MQHYRPQTDSSPPPLGEGGEAVRITSRAIRGPTWGVVGIVLMGAVVLYFFNPAQYSFYPACLFHRWTGLACPGCGSLRALHHLAHGEIAAAFRLNPLLILALIPAVWIGWRKFRQCTQGRLAAEVAAKWPTLWMLLAAVAMYGVLRNLPLWPETWYPN